MTIWASHICCVCVCAAGRKNIKAMMFFARAFTQHAVALITHSVSSACKLIHSYLHSFAYAGSVWALQPALWLFTVQRLIYHSPQIRCSSPAADWIKTFYSESFKRPSQHFLFLFFLSLSSSLWLLQLRLPGLLNWSDFGLVILYIWLKALISVNCIALGVCSESKDVTYYQMAI